MIVSDIRVMIFDFGIVLKLKFVSDIGYLKIIRSSYMFHHRYFSQLHSLRSRSPYNGRQVHHSLYKAFQRITGIQCPHMHNLRMNMVLEKIFI